MKRPILLLLISCTVTNCATMSWKQRSVAYTATAFTSGASLGALQAGKNQDKTKHALLWGGLFGLGVSLLTVLFYDESNLVKLKQKRIKELEIRLKNSKSAFVKKNYSSNYDGGKTDFFEKSLPKDLRGVIQPGEWKMYKIDEWKKEGAGILIHQDKMLEYKKPELLIDKEL